jgi:hypothetical protein
MEESDIVILQQQNSMMRPNVVGNSGTSVMRSFYDDIHNKAIAMGIPADSNFEDKRDAVLEAEARSKKKVSQVDGYMSKK